MRDINKYYEGCGIKRQCDNEEYKARNGEIRKTREAMYV
jgi:hypothetical protein